MIGRVEHRKNLPIAVQAVQRLRRQGVEIELHVAGAVPNANGAAIRRFCERIADGNWLRWHGEVDDASLWKLLEETSALLFPSYYEGFGFPPVEAVMAGVPALASDIAAHRETLGGIVPLLPTDSAEAWAEGIAAIIDRRTQIPVDAVAQLERRGITWETCAERTAQIYARVASEHERRRQPIGIQGKRPWRNRSRSLQLAGMITGGERSETARLWRGVLWLARSDSAEGSVPVAHARLQRCGKPE